MRKIHFGWIFILVYAMTFNVTVTSAMEPKRVIMFMIDGMHWQAPEKLHMPALNSLIKEGTYVRKSYMIIPHHPTVGDYSKYNSCSFPNPMLHEGTIFLSPDNKMIQEMLSPKQTAFVVNTSAYRSVARGFTTSINDNSLTDEQTLQQAIHLLEMQEIHFMRIHLQSPGDIGTNIAMSSAGKPYSRDIFGKVSPYVEAIENADRLLGQFITYLKKTGKWDDTVLIVTSDHAQSIVGWHPMLDEDSWMTPLVFTGVGIARGRELPYFEHIDLAPTIAMLLGVQAPNRGEGAGKAVEVILENRDMKSYKPDTYIKTINQQIREYNILYAKMVLVAEKNNYVANIISSLSNQNLTPEPFYHQDRIMEWYKAGSTEHLIEANEVVLQKMRETLQDNQ